MNVGPESHEAAHLRRVLVISETPWLRSATRALEDADEDESIAVDHLTPEEALDHDSFVADDGQQTNGHLDCVLTDDLEVVRAKRFGDRVPIVFAVDSPTATTLESVSSAVTEFVTIVIGRIFYSGSVAVCSES
ncbi:hypothetical protein, partial [Natronoglomus mannanivorans]|nr:hypothetical protein [Halobacteria archaeon AArc-xg1-1]